MRNGQPDSVHYIFPLCKPTEECDINGCQRRSRTSPNMAGEHDHVAQYSGGDYSRYRLWEASCQPMRPSGASDQDSEVDSHTLPETMTMLRTEKARPLGEKKKFYVHLFIQMNFVCKPHCFWCTGFSAEGSP